MLPILAEHKKKIGLKHKGKIVSDKARENMRLAKKDMICKKPLIINQYDLEGNFIKEWDSALDASIELNINRQNITACCTKRAKTTGGFKWKYNI